MYTDVLALPRFAHQVSAYAPWRARTLPPAMPRCPTPPHTCTVDPGCSTLSPAYTFISDPAHLQRGRNPAARSLEQLGIKLREEGVIARGSPSISVGCPPGMCACGAEGSTNTPKLVAGEQSDRRALPCRQPVVIDPVTRSYRGWRRGCRSSMVFVGCSTFEGQPYR
jgi:hypothetical protein